MVDTDIESDTHRFDVKYVSPPSATHYRGAVVQDRATNQLIVINKGTDPTNVHDLLADLGMGMMGAPAQWPEAAQTMRWALQHARAEGLAPTDISITGHSLGGALAQLQAALPEAEGMHAETFNAFGARAMAEALSRVQPLDIGSAQRRVVNHRMYHDPVSLPTRHIGETVDYMGYRDYRVHERGGLAPLAEAATIAASHGIGNFWDRERNQPGEVLAHNWMQDLQKRQHRKLDDLPPGVPLDLSAPWHLLGEHERGPATRSPSMGSASLSSHTGDVRRHLAPDDQALYSALQERVPDAGPKRLLQFTAACHANGITAENLERIHLSEEHMTIEFHGRGWLAAPAVIDLSRDAPEPVHSMRQIQQVDEQQMEIAQHIAQSAQLSQRGLAR